MKLRDFKKAEVNMGPKRHCLTITDGMQIVQTRTAVQIWSSDEPSARLLAEARVQNPKQFNYQALLEIAKYDFASGISA